MPMPVDSCTKMVSILGRKDLCIEARAANLAEWLNFKFPGKQ